MMQFSRFLSVFPFLPLDIAYIRSEHKEERLRVTFTNNRTFRAFRLGEIKRRASGVGTRNHVLTVVKCFLESPFLLRIKTLFDSDDAKIAAHRETPRTFSADVRHCWLESRIVLLSFACNCWELTSRWLVTVVRREGKNKFLIQFYVHEKEKHWENSSFGLFILLAAVAWLDSPEHIDRVHGAGNRVRLELAKSW